MQRQIRYFEMQCERNPHSRHFLALADLHRQAGDHALAIEILSDGLSRCGDSISARYLLGACLDETGDPIAAAEHFERVLDKDPKHAFATEALEHCRSKSSMAPVDDVAEEDTPCEPGESAVEAAPPEPADDERKEARPAEALEPEPEPEPDPVAAPIPEIEPAAAVADARRDDSIPSMFVTRTLADIYLSQGHKDKALRILYQVLAAHPEREDIVSRIAELERGAGVQSPNARTSPDETGEDDEDSNRRRFDQWVDQTRKEP